MSLYAYQEQGVDFLAARRRAYLADDCGLGKTVQALMTLVAWGVTRVLVVCPAAAVGNWYREAGEWAPGIQLTAVSYASLHRVGGAFDAVVLDEAHYVKTRRAKRTKLALRLGKAAPRTILLSATPMPNHPGELWTVFDAFWPELLGFDIRSERGWFDTFCAYRNTPFGPKVYGMRSAPRFRALMAKVMLRRRLDDVALDLPPLRTTLDVLPCTARSFEAMLAQEPGATALLRSLTHEQAKDTPSLSRLRRIIGEYKAPHIAEKLRVELEEKQYDKIVVLYHHTSVGDILAAELAPFGVVRLDGRTRDRQGVVDTFTHDPRVRVFLGQQTAAGEAINLQAASELVLVEPAWTPDANLQAIKRIHRIGQDRPCRARVFAVAKTSDEAVMGTLALKTTMSKEGGFR